MKPKISTERGQALILVALAAIGLFGITALAIDGSAKYSDRRYAQNAADTAALAGALTLAREKSHGNGVGANCPPAGVPSAACAKVVTTTLDQADENGFNGDGIKSIVEVNIPPKSGIYSDCSDVHFDCNDYVQVVITSYVDTWFARILGINQTTNVVQAVASTIAEDNHFNFGGNAIVALSPTGCALKAGGGTSITIDGGGMYSNSEDSCSFQKTTCAGTIDIDDGNGNTGTITMVGGAHINTNCWDPTGATLNPGGQKQYMFPPPYEEIPEPAECSTNGTKTNNNTANTTTLTPGYFASLPPSGQTKKTLYLTPGVYCVGSTVSSSGLDNFKILPPAVYGDNNGVFIYIKPGGNFSMNSDTNVELWAIKDETKPYNGYLFYVAANYSLAPTGLPKCKINGSSTSKYQGTIYAPYCDIFINGNSGMTLESQIVGYTVDMTGASGISLVYDDNTRPFWTIPLQVGLTK